MTFPLKNPWSTDSLGKVAAAYVAVDQTWGSIRLSFRVAIDPLHAFCAGFLRLPERLSIFQSSL